MNNIQKEEYELPHIKQLIVEFLQDIINKRDSHYIAKLTKINPDLVNYITQTYPTNHVGESVFRYLNNTITSPLCGSCGLNYTTFASYIKGYRQYCCHKCGTGATSSEKRKQTNLKKYGTVTPLTSPSGREKTKQFNLKKYGVDHFSKTEEYREKFTATMKTRHGVEYSGQSLELLTKQKETCMCRYGVDTYSQTEEFRDRFIQTMNANYGVDYAMQSDELKERHRLTLQNNYGVDYPLQNAEVRQKMQQTMVDRYGKEFTAQVHTLHEKMVQTNLERYGVEYPIQSTEYRQKMEELGKWIPLELWTDFELYYRQVWKFTRLQPIKELEYFGVRGLAGIDGAYHLDHKYSIKYGFINSVPPYIIGSIHNLEMLPWFDNVYKGERCSMELEHLCDLFYLY
jgi:hypothetical protein